MAAWTALATAMATIAPTLAAELTRPVATTTPVSAALLLVAYER